MTDTTEREALGELERLYPMWLEKALAEARADLRCASQSLASLKNRQGTYFDAISSMCAARQRILDWMELPASSAPPAEEPDSTPPATADDWQARALAAEAKLAAQAAAVPTHPDVVSRYAEGWEDGMAEATKLMSEPDFQSSESETADHLAEAILSGMSYSELREKAIYLMALNANQARTIDALIAAAQGGASHADQG